MRPTSSRRQDSDPDKSELLRAVLTHYGFVRIPEHGGNRSILCALHGDSHQSASVNIDAGVFNCFTCGIAGDGYSIIMHQQGVDFIGAKSWAEANLDAVGPAVRGRDRPAGSHLPGLTRDRKHGGRGLPAWKRDR